MRRIQQVPIKKERVKGVTINAHPYLYEQMEKLRKQNQQKWGVCLSQIELTGLLAKRINMTAPTIRDITGGSNVKKKRRHN